MEKQIHPNDQHLSDFGAGISLWYHPTYLTEEVQQQLVSYLNTFLFCEVAYPKFGQVRKTPRLTYCYGQWESQSVASYRGKSFQTEPIPIWLQQLKAPIEEYFGLTFNAVIMNKYVDGQHQIGWHKDDEQFLAHQTIASITLGTERDFQFRAGEKTQTHELSLKSGSLTVFGDGLYHSLPKRTKCCGVRYNITFRSVQSAQGIGNYYYYNRGC